MRKPLLQIRVPLASDAQRQFGGSPPAREGEGEPPMLEASQDELAAIRDGYDALDARSHGQYSEFLRHAARCDRCARDRDIPSDKQPIPLLCGDGHFQHLTNWKTAHADLEAYRRADGTLRFDPFAPSASSDLGRFLEERELTGLSVGHCGRDCEVAIFSAVLAS